MRVNYFLWLIRAASVITMKRTFSKKRYAAVWGEGEAIDYEI